MSEDIKLISYKEIIKKKSLGYYDTNRDAICKKKQRKIQYVNSRTKKKKIGKSIKSVGMKACHLKENKR